MAKRTYPGVDRVKDDPVRISLRALWDRLFTVQELLERVQANQLTTAQVQGLINSSISGLQAEVEDLGNASGGGGGTSLVCDPLTDGDPVSPSLIFDSFGNVIMTCVGS